MKGVIAFLILVSVLLAACGSPEPTGNTAAENNLDRLARLEKIYSIDPQKEQEGKQLGDVHFDDIISGKTNHLDEIGKIVIVETFSVGCPSCAELIKEYNVLYDKYGDDIEIIYLGVSEEDTKDAILEIKELYNGRDWLWVEFDPELTPFYDDINMYTNEQTFVIDKDLVIKYADSFKTPMSKIEAAITELI